MSDTIPDIQASSDVYVDINTLSGIVAGSAIVVENKSSNNVLLQISASQPAADSQNGTILHNAGDENSIKVITAGENTVWAKSIGSTSADISVQENI